jgi:hypothetical protein
VTTTILILCSQDTREPSLNPGEKIMNLYSMAQVGSAVGLPERFFVTREKGAQAYALLKARLETIAEGQALVLDFPAAQLMDASFADESIVRLGEETMEWQFGARGLLLMGLTDDTVHNLQAVIQLRHLKLAFLLVTMSGEWRVIGQLEASLHETLDIVARYRQLTAPQLTDLLGLAINTASNRLKRLYDQRLVRREYDISDKGLQYIYYFWEW